MYALGKTLLSQLLLIGVLVIRVRLAFGLGSAKAGRNDLCFVFLRPTTGQHQHNNQNCHVTRMFHSVSSANQKSGCMVCCA